MPDDDAKKRRKYRRYGMVAAVLTRIVGKTLRMRIHDHCGFVAEPPENTVIHAVWHNQVFAWSEAMRRGFPDRKGAILTSASKDGEVVAAVIEDLGHKVIRGSSSRRGAAALIELKRQLEAGVDVGVTPDGPRGPRHELNPGIVALAQKTGAPIMPTRLVLRRSWKLKTWDRFEIPVPFSRVDVHLGPYLEIPATATPEEFEAQRLRVQAAMCVDDPS